MKRFHCVCEIIKAYFPEWARKEEEEAEERLREKDPEAWAKRVGTKLAKEMMEKFRKRMAKGG